MPLTPKPIDLHVVVEFQPRRAAEFKALPADDVLSEAKKSLNLMGIPFPKNHNVKRVEGDLLYLFWPDGKTKAGLYPLLSNLQRVSATDGKGKNKRDKAQVLTVVVKAIDAGRPFDVRSVLSDTPESQPADRQPVESSPSPLLSVAPSPLPSKPWWIPDDQLPEPRPADRQTAECSPSPSLLVTPSPLPSKPWWIPDDQPSDYEPPPDILNSPRASSPDVEATPDFSVSAKPFTLPFRPRSPTIEPGEVLEVRISPSKCNAGAQASVLSSSPSTSCHKTKNGLLDSGPERDSESSPSSRLVEDPHSSSSDMLLDPDDVVSSFVPHGDGLTKESRETIEQLARKFQETQGEIRAAQARSRRLARELERFGIRKSAFAVDERRRACESEASGASNALRVERRRRIRAEQALAEVMAERQAPFVVPALLEAFMEIAVLSEGGTFPDGVEG